MKTPTINIGDRQKGRMMADSVICCEPKREAIVRAMNTALTNEFQEKAKHIKSPFGDGSTSEKIMEHIVKFLRSERISHEKKFYDIAF